MARCGCKGPDTHFMRGFQTNELVSPRSRILLDYLFQHLRLLSTWRLAWTIADYIHMEVELEVPSEHGLASTWSGQCLPFFIEISGLWMINCLAFLTLFCFFLCWIIWITLERSHPARLAHLETVNSNPRISSPDTSLCIRFGHLNFDSWQQ